ncbi:unnamed protein product [Brassica rapa]|uniref:Uncharacterized protein n=1 Tax=Brassica campestris TaxID=3711 RepID=A0A8D9GT57_BRACM|nr:unnamed protein product [Brassica rapa]
MQGGDHLSACKVSYQSSVISFLLKLNFVIIMTHTANN